MAVRLRRRGAGWFRPPAVRQWVILVGGLGLGALAYSNAAGGVDLSLNPEAAVGQLGYGAFPKMAQADLALRIDPKAGAVGTPSALARDSLKAQPINPGALRMLGAAEAQRDHDAQAMRYFALSEGLSRRDPTTQAWLVIHALKEDNLAGGMNHFDAALRVIAGDQQNTLLEILTRGLVDRPVQQALVPYIRGNAPWLANLVVYQISAGGDPSPLVQSIIDAGGLPKAPPIFREYETQLLTGLSGARRTDMLARYYLTLPGAHADAMTSAAFTPTTLNPAYGPMSWHDAGSTDISSAFEETNRAGVRHLHVIASSGLRSVAATKTALVAPGTYTLTAPLQAVRMGRRASAEWQVQCARTGTSLPLVKTSVAGRSVGARFAVPAKCGGVVVALVAGGGEEADGAEFYLESPSLSRVSGNEAPPQPDHLPDTNPMPSAVTDPDKAL